VIEYCAAFTQLYREEAHYLERTAPWLERVGLAHIKACRRGRSQPQGAGGTLRRLAETGPDRSVGGTHGGRADARIYPHPHCRLRRKANLIARKDTMTDWIDIGAARRHPPPGFPRGADGGGRHRRIPHPRRRGVRPARPLSAQGRPAVAGHRSGHRRSPVRCTTGRSPSTPARRSRPTRAATRYPVRSSTVGSGCALTLARTAGPGPRQAGIQINDWETARG
jgi:hypothetical protein